MQTFERPEPEPPEEKEPTVERLMEYTGNWPMKILGDVGRELHDGRKVDPITEDEAPDLTYDERIGITYAPLDIETQGFRIIAKPRRIGVREVAKYAKPSCKRCHGVGFQKREQTQITGRSKMGQKIMEPFSYDASCPCADREFQKVIKHMLIDSQLSEWIMLDDLTIEEVVEIKVEGIGLGEKDVPEMQGIADVQSSGETRVPELSDSD